MESAHKDYAIRGGIEGKRRLDLLAQVMAPTTDDLLRQAGIQVGMRCIDLGCGGGHVSTHIARLVGKTGSVVGIDRDDVQLASARHECAELGLPVEFRIANIADWHEPETYDLVYGRFILAHLSNRATVLSRMVEALKPKGVLVLEDVDFTGCFSYPPNDEFKAFCTLYRELLRRRGGDADLGPQLYGFCLDAGLRNVEMRVVQPAHAGHHPGKTLTLSTLLNICDAVLQEEIASPAAVEATVAGLTRFTEDPGSVIGHPRIFQVWGRR